MCNRSWRWVIPFCAVLGLLGGWPWGAVEVRATTVYSYIDDQGNAVLTDQPETIPEKYRAKVKTHERPDGDKKPASTVATVKERIVEKVKGLGATIPSVKMNLKSLGSSQSDVLNSAGIAAGVLLCVIYFSKNSPMIRLLALGLLFLLAIGTPVLMYTSDGGALDVMKQKASATGRSQPDRLQQAPQ